MKWIVKPYKRYADIVNPLYISITAKFKLILARAK